MDTLSSTGNLSTAQLLSSSTPRTEALISFVLILDSFFFFFPLRHLTENLILLPFWPLARFLIHVS